MNSNQSSILLIEDDPNYIQVLMYELIQLGWDVNSVNTIKDAQEFLLTSKPEIIVSDIFLPDGSGLDFTNELIQIAPNSLVILITGFPDLNQAINSLGGNVYDYILKPFKVEQLILVIQRARTIFYLKKEIEVLKNENSQFREIILEKGLNPDELISRENDKITGNYKSPNEMYAKQVRKSRTPVFNKSIKNKD
tara:strand:+ start:837 stop:1418 length:582 start_codon:yes stop_codon:yes gene_type:complete